MKEYLHWLWHASLEIARYRGTGALGNERASSATIDYYVPITKNPPKRIIGLGTIAQNQYKTNACTGFNGGHAVSIEKTIATHHFHTQEGTEVWKLQLDRGTADPAKGDYIESAPIALEEAGIITKYEKVRRSDFEATLADGKKIMTGARIGHPMCDKNWVFRTGQNEGGHAFLLIGYDETYFYALNSWGENWGHKASGRFKIRKEDVSRLFTPFVIIL